MHYLYTYNHAKTFQYANPSQVFNIDIVLVQFLYRSKQNGEYILYCHLGCRETINEIQHVIDCFPDDGRLYKRPKRRASFCS